MWFKNEESGIKQQQQYQVGKIQSVRFQICIHLLGVCQLADADAEYCLTYLVMAPFFNKVLKYCSM
jgi:hypothetical protein